MKRSKTHLFRLLPVLFAVLVFHVVLPAFACGDTTPVSDAVPPVVRVLGWP